MTPRQRRSGVLARTALAVALVLLGLFALPPAALANEVDQKREEAARIQAELDKQAERIADLDRQLGDAQGKAEDAGEEANRARAELAAAEEEWMTLAERREELESAR